MNPTIYIIGGLPRTGKSTLARRLMLGHGMEGMETDHVRAMFDADPQSMIGFETNAGIDRCTERLAPYLGKLITFMVKANTDFVINGEAIEPKLVVSSPHVPHLRSCFLGMSDVEATFDNVRSHATSHDWTRPLADDTLYELLEKYAYRSQKLSRACTELGLKYIDVSLDFGGGIDEAERYLTTPAPSVLSELTVSQN